MAELDDIPSNFTVGDYITVTAGNDALCLTNQGEGKLRFLCDPSHLSWDDPIVYPGQSGAAHLHHFFGNTLVHAGSTYQSLRTTGDGTCAGGPINRTGYWYPAVIKPAGPGFPVAKVVKPAFIELYYVIGATNTLTDYDTANPDAALAHPTYGLQRFPRGLQMVWGWKHDDGSTPFGVWSRVDTTDATGAGNGGLEGPYYGTFADLATNMPSTSTEDNIFARIESPGCWDGVNLTLGGGRTHIAYEVQDGLGHLVCPATHPYRIPKVLVIVAFSHNGPSDFSTWFLSSDSADYGGHDHIGGTTFHTDWFGAWDSTISSIWETTILQVGGTSANQKTSTSGRLCVDDKQLTNSGRTYASLATDAFGGKILPEADRYLDIPARRRWARLPPAIQLRAYR